MEIEIGQNLADAIRNIALASMFAVMTWAVFRIFK